MCLRTFFFSPSSFFPLPFFLFFPFFLFDFRFTVEHEGETHLLAASLLLELAEKGTLVMFASENRQCFHS